MLFQYAAVLHPTEKQTDDGRRPEIIVDVTTVVAGSQDKAVLLAARDISEEYADQLEQIEVVVRPF